MLRFNTRLKEEIKLYTQKCKYYFLYVNILLMKIRRIFLVMKDDSAERKSIFILSPKKKKKSFIFRMFENP